MKLNLKSLLPHLGACVGFVIVALLYFSPVLSGKKIYQSDIVWYEGMAKEIKDFRKATGEETYWTDSAFGGMPTYQLGAKYPNNYIKKLDLAIRILPRPADYLLLYFLGFYLLMLSLRLNWKYAALGALAFGFSTYLIVILGVGHNAKAHAIAYMPLVLTGVVLVFRKCYWLGFAITAIGMGLEIVANHLQMTYYLMLLILVLGVVYGINAIRKQWLPHFLKSVVILFAAVLLAIGMNATNLMATSEYTAFSTRGKSEITINPDGTSKENVGGLDKNYINQYSYGISETLNLFVARLFGGSNDEPFEKDSEIAGFLRSVQVPPSQMEDVYGQFRLYYWGSQPGVSGPAYIGAVIIFLFILALFLVKDKLKWWLLGGTILSILLSYGKNLSWFTDLWVDYFPLYDKFRAVTSIQVIAELCVPALAIYGLWYFVKSDTVKEEKLKALKWSTIVAGGTALILLLGQGMFDFSAPADARLLDVAGMDIINAIKDDRKSLYQFDVIKTLILVLGSAGILWYLLRGKLKENVALILFAVLIVFDLVHIDRNYVNTDNFVAARVMEKPFQPNRADLDIVKDTSRFRVYEEQVSIGTSRSSYFHKSIGGYHGAKPKRIQDIADFYLYNGKIGPLNLLNVKYIIRGENNDNIYAQRNPGAVGNAWFVNEVELVPDANSELLALDSLPTKRKAIVHQEFESQLSQKQFKKDTTAIIQLVEDAPNYLKYNSSTSSEQLALFSEIYYPQGWQAYMDGNPVTHFRADYLLRAMIIPSGSHTIEFKFEPAVVKRGSLITLLSSISLIVILGFGGFKKRQDLRAIFSKEN